MAQDYAVVLLCNHCRVEQHKGCSMLLCGTNAWLAVALQDTAMGYLGNRYSRAVHCRSKQTLAMYLTWWAMTSRSESESW